MAEHNEVAYTTADGNDYPAHEQTYEGFIMLVKYGTASVAMMGRAAAEDCVQDAFERAYKKWPNWQPIAPAEAWVHRIAVNAAVSHQRKMRLREVGEVIRRIDPPGLAPDPQAGGAPRPRHRLGQTRRPARRLRSCFGTTMAKTNRAESPRPWGSRNARWRPGSPWPRSDCAVMLKNSYGPGAR